MAKDSIQQFSTSAPSNTDIAGINVNTGWPPSNVGSAFRTLMSFLADSLIPQLVDLTGVTSFTLSAEQASGQVIRFTGAPTGNCTVTVPDAFFVGIANNETTGGHNVLLKAGAGSQPTLLPDSRYVMYLCGGDTNVSLLPLSVGDLVAAGVAFLGCTSANSNPVSTLTPGWKIPTSGSAIAYATGGAPTLNVGNSVGSCIAFYNFSGTVVGSVTNTNTATAFNTTSDARLKIDDGVISPDEAGRIVDRLVPRWFRFKSESDGGRQPGFFAQQVSRVFPWAVTKGVGRKGRDGYRPWQMDAGKMMPIVIAELKALRLRVAELEAR